MPKIFWWLIAPVVVVAVSVVACSASKPASEGDATAVAPKIAAGPPGATPTPLPMSRTNPNIVEEDEYHYVERLPKEDYLRIDNLHIRHPNVGPAVEIYKEDEKYYYIYVKKRNTELDALLRLHATPSPTPTPLPAPLGMSPTRVPPPLADFEDLSPARVSGRLRLAAVTPSGLPQEGAWRASFVIADMNGDGIPDIVAPPPRSGDTQLHIWIGDGKGTFSPWPLRFIENGKPAPEFGIGYGAVAVGDIDGDGHLDIVTASHGGGLVSLFGDGKGTFRVVREGLPMRDFSSQAIGLVDADGDGKLDIVASTDTFSGRANYEDMVRVYLYRGVKGWEFKSDGLVGAAFSNSLHVWDFNRDGRGDILTASHNLGMIGLLWKNLGNGRFELEPVPPIEIYSYHFSTVPGTFGAKRSPAFAGAHQMFMNDPEIRTTGITVYSFEGGIWTRHRVWRKKSGQSAQYALAMGDLDGDGLDDVVFPDSEVNRLRIFFQKPDGGFVEMAEKEEPVLDSPGQCVRLADLNGDGRLDIVLSKAVSSYRPNDKGGWDVYLNQR